MWLWFYFVCSQVSKRTSASGNWHQHKFTARESWSSKEFRFSLSICYFNYLINRFVSVCMYIYNCICMLAFLCMFVCERERMYACECIPGFCLQDVKTTHDVAASPASLTWEKCVLVLLTKMELICVEYICGMVFFSLCIVTYVKTVA